MERALRLALLEGHRSRFIRVLRSRREHIPVGIGVRRRDEHQPRSCESRRRSESLSDRVGSFDPSFDGMLVRGVVGRSDPGLEGGRFGQPTSNRVSQERGAGTTARRVGIVAARGAHATATEGIGGGPGAHVVHFDL
jgi:hypothetical protein